MPSLRWKAIFTNFKCFCLLGPNLVLTVVTARRVSCLKVSLQYLKKIDQVTKWIPWGTFQFEGPVRVWSCLYFVPVTRSTSRFLWKRRLNILGVYFTCDKCASIVEENLTGRVGNIKTIINAWEKRNLKIAGKFYTIKTCLISQFVDTMQTLEVSNSVLTQMNRSSLKFCGEKNTVIAKHLRKWRAM